MSKHIDKLLQKWDEFQCTHTKVYTPEIRSRVFSLYHQLQLELADEATFVLNDENSMASITITAASFLSSTDFPALQQLIGEADTFQADIVNGCIVFDLFFVFWKWMANP